MILKRLFMPVMLLLATIICTIIFESLGKPYDRVTEDVWLIAFLLITANAAAFFMVDFDQEPKPIVGHCLVWPLYLLRVTPFLVLIDRSLIAAIIGVIIMVISLFISSKIVMAIFPKQGEKKENDHDIENDENP